MLGKFTPGLPHQTASGFAGPRLGDSSCRHVLVGGLAQSQCDGTCPLEDLIFQGSVCTLENSLRTVNWRLQGTSRIKKVEAFPKIQRNIKKHSCPWPPSQEPCNLPLQEHGGCAGPHRRQPAWLQSGFTGSNRRHCHHDKAAIITEHGLNATIKWHY